MFLWNLDGEMLKYSIIKRHTMSIYWTSFRVIWITLNFVKINRSNDLKLFSYESFHDRQKLKMSSFISMQKSHVWLISFDKKNATAKYWKSHISYLSLRLFLFRRRLSISFYKRCFFSTKSKSFGVICIL